MHFLAYIALVGFLEIAFREGIFASDQTTYDDLKELNVTTYDELKELNATTYDELKELNVACDPMDSCQEERDYDPPTLTDFSPYKCSCHSECSEFGTCCVDSPFRKQLPPTHHCRSIELPISLNGDAGYYMVQNCPNDSGNNMVWKRLCEREWEGDEDLMMIAPVISLDTKRAYKNYYCLRCHETTTNFLNWNLLLQGDYTGPGSDTIEPNDLSVTYDRTAESWIATAADQNVSFSVMLKFEIPQGFEGFGFIKCNPRIISDCSDSWTDKRVQDKCHSYTALLYRGSVFKNIIFKNVHCALCNFADLELLKCYPSKVFIIKKIFSFVRLIDVRHMSDKDKVGKGNLCEANHVWDPYRLKCTKLVCAIPTYVITDGKCSPP